MIQDLDKRIAEKPIDVPPNPYVRGIIDFLRDEMLAGGLDVVSTTVANSVVDPENKAAVLPFVGPVMEKGMFFPAHFWDAWKIYRTLPQELKGQGFGHYAAKAIKEGGENLILDVTVHDPLYIGFMVLGLRYGIPPALLSATSYLGAAVIAACVKVAKGEVQQVRQRRKLHKIGFESEKYYESRFLVRKEYSLDELTGKMAGEFNLKNVGSMTYNDIYFDNSRIPRHNGRSAKLRLRERESEDGQKLVQSAQLVFTLANELKRADLEQYRYFVLGKEKIYFRLDDQPMPQTLEGIADPQVRNYLLNVSSGEVKKVQFHRTALRSDDLLVCADQPNGREFYVVEIKARHDLKKLQKAMRYLMVNCPVGAVETTYGKMELLN